MNRTTKKIHYLFLVYLMDVYSCLVRVVGQVGY